MRSHVTPAVLVCSLVIAFGGASASRSACINGGTQADIQAALNSISKTAELCQSSTFLISSPILVTKKNSRIFTTGYPTSDTLKARLLVVSNFDQVVVQAYSASGVEIRNIVVDGQRFTASDYKCHQALMAVSGNSSWVDSVTLQNTRGLSALDSSSNPSCSGLQITNSKFLNNGFHTPGAYQCGEFTQGPWADAIDYRCSNGYVAFNQVTNATDGAISFFGGTNTVMEYNTIVNNSRSAYSGIIAASLYAGNFTGSVVRYNDVSTSGGQHAHVALAIGTHLWCPAGETGRDCQQGTGVSFLNNTGTGTWGWGINVDGHNNATVQGNNLVMTPWFPINCQQTPFNNYYTVNLAHSSGSFQPGYVNRQTHWPCLDSTPSGQ
jgi:hypothetical protein